MTSDLRSPRDQCHPNPDQERPLGKVRADAEREHILSILEMTHGRRGEAAQILGISRKTLWKKLKDYDVSWPR